MLGLEGSADVFLRGLVGRFAGLLPKGVPQGPRQPCQGERVAALALCQDRLSRGDLRKHLTYGF